MSKAVCEPVRIKSNRKDTCETCCFWDKEDPVYFLYGVRLRPSGQIRIIHPCCKTSNSLGKLSTEWCGEWEAKVKLIEEPKQITDERRNYNAIYRRQNSEKVPEVLRRRIH